ncbi:hypothetical protein HMPREF0102_01956 [Bacteroides sp. 2_1_22]|nr:hypothetical protein HMPREF0102_01956 [Bacteroides sp. 2_1_22]
MLSIDVIAVCKNPRLWEMVRIVGLLIYIYHTKRVGIISIVKTANSSNCIYLNDN